MADRSPDRGGDVTGLHRVHLTRHQPELGGGKYSSGAGGMMGGASPTKVLALLAIIPAGGTLLALAGITLIGTLIGLAVATPLFILFSPVLVPAAIVLGLVVTGFLTSGAFGLTALASISRVVSYMRQGGRGSGPEGIEWAKRQAQDTAGYVGQKTKEVGQQIQGKAREGART